MSTLLVWKDQIEKFMPDILLYCKDTAVRVGIMCIRTDQFQYRIYESIILYSLYSWSCCCYGLSSGRDAGTCSSPACSGTSVCTVFAGSGIMSGNFLVMYIFM